MKSYKYRRDYFPMTGLACTVKYYSHAQRRKGLFHLTHSNNWNPTRVATPELSQEYTSD